MISIRSSCPYTGTWPFVGTASPTWPAFSSPCGYSHFTLDEVVVPGTPNGEWPPSSVLRLGFSRGAVSATCCSTTCRASRAIRSRSSIFGRVGWRVMGGSSVAPSPSISSRRPRRRLSFGPLTSWSPWLRPASFWAGSRNFINGELWGKITDLPWAVIFPQSAPPGTALDQIPPRHPSQIYEAALEGLVLFAYIQFRFWKRGRLPARPAGGIPDGQLAGEFFVAYAALRILGELFREPDSAGLIMGLSRGTFYSLILGLVGLCWIFAVRWAGRGGGGGTDRGEAIGRKASS